jgi:hypothetical protein
MSKFSIKDRGIIEVSVFRIQVIQREDWTTKYSSRRILGIALDERILKKTEDEESSPTNKAAEVHPQHN